MGISQIFLKNKLNQLEVSRKYDELYKIQMSNFYLYRQIWSLTNINRQEASLRTCSDANSLISVDSIQIFTDHLLQLEKDIKLRFYDILKFKSLIIFIWI